MSAAPNVGVSTGFFHRCPQTYVPGTSFTEWQHLAIATADVTVLVNLSLQSDETSSGLIARVIVLVCDGAWHGEIDTYPQHQIFVRAGQPDLRFGPNLLAHREGTIRVRAALERAPIAVDLLLTPRSTPFFANNVRLGSARLSWSVLPRLEASGTVSVNGRVHRLEGAPAYLDHNWGSFSWNADMAWEWGYAVPNERESPWTCVYTRLGDRARNETWSTSVILWKDNRLIRVFRNRAVTVRPDGFHRQHPLHTLPRELSGLVPGSASGVPARLHWSATEGADRLVGVWTSGRAARIVAPSAGGGAPTVLHEVTGELSVFGNVGGEPVRLFAPGVLEVVNG